MSWKGKNAPADSVEPINAALNTISSGTNIIGDINSTGNIRFDGTLKGNLNTKGRLFVGETGVIEGDINCNSMEIEGTVTGKMYVAEILSFKKTAVVTGEIVTGKLAIEPGAVFNGTCKMTKEKAQLGEKAPAK